MADRTIKACANGMTITVSVEAGKCIVRVSGHVTPAARKAAEQLNHTTMRPEWVVGQIVKAIAN